jgi:hypothetical protein
LNLFPRDTPYSGPVKGLTTLNFVPLIGTMILGLIAGDVLRSSRDLWAKVRWFGVAGIAGVCCGWMLGVAGICPVVKRKHLDAELGAVQWWLVFSVSVCFSRNDRYVEPEEGCIPFCRHGNEFNPGLLHGAHLPRSCFQ